MRSNPPREGRCRCKPLRHPWDQSGYDNGSRFPRAKGRGFHLAALLVILEPDCKSFCLCDHMKIVAVKHFHLGRYSYRTRTGQPVEDVPRRPEMLESDPEGVIQHSPGSRMRTLG